MLQCACAPIVTAMSIKLVVVAGARPNFMKVAPLIAAFAMWARLPRLRALLPSSAIRLAAWIMVFVLSIAPLILTWFY